MLDTDIKPEDFLTNGEYWLARGLQPLLNGCPTPCQGFEPDIYNSAWRGHSADCLCSLVEGQHDDAVISYLGEDGVWRAVSEACLFKADPDLYELWQNEIEGN